MSVQVLASLLGPEFVQRLSETDVARLSDVIVKTINEDSRARERLIAVVNAEVEQMEITHA